MFHVDSIMPLFRSGGEGEGGCWELGLLMRESEGEGGREHEGYRSTGRQSTELRQPVPHPP
jgi:hypothetical protein